MTTSGSLTVGFHNTVPHLCILNPYQGHEAQYQHQGRLRAHYYLCKWTPARLPVSYSG